MRSDLFVKLKYDLKHCNIVRWY